MLGRLVPDSPFVSYEPGALTVPPWGDEEEGEGGTFFYLTGPRPQDIGEALDAASCVFMNVAEDGRILTDEQVMAGGVLRTPDAEGWDVLYTANFLFPVEVGAAGARVSLDTKGMLYGPMVRTLVALIVEELTARQVTARFAIVPDGTVFTDLHPS